jgi:PRTRC genetic system protein C
MALIATGIKRVFKMKNVILQDPNPEFTPEEVLSFYSNAHPELTNSTITEPKIIDDQYVYEFKTTVGTKG